MKYKAFGYLYPDSLVVLKELVLSETDAIRKHYRPVTYSCLPLERWILHNCIKDCKRLGLYYCLVFDNNNTGGMSLWCKSIGINPNR